MTRCRCIRDRFVHRLPSELQADTGIGRIGQYRFRLLYVRHRIVIFLSVRETGKSQQQANE